MQGAKAQYWIKRLALKGHPEGGYYAETQRTSMVLDIKGLKGPRNLCSTIYFLLKGGQFSAFHRLKSDEVWHFYCGSPLTLYVIGKEDGKMSEIKLGGGRGGSFQATIEHGSWFAAKVNSKKSYSLIGCTVSPAFDYADFEMADREALSRQYPHYKETIKNLTR